MRSFAVDWKAIDSPAAVDRAVNDLVQKADVFLTARTGEAPSAQVRALIADAVGVDEKALLANPRMAIREKEINATAMLADEARSQLVQLNAQFLAHSADAPGKAVLATELDHQIQRTAMVFEKLYQYREEAGLALRTFGTEAKGAVQSAEKTRQLIEELRSSGLPLDRFSSLLAALPEPVQQAGFLRRVFSGGASGLDYLAEYFIQGLLTSPFGHAANIAANAVQYGMAVGAQAIVNPSRAYYMLVGAAHSFPEALEAWWNTVKTGVSPFGESKVGLGQAKSKGFAGLAERLSAGAGPDDWATHFLARTLNGMTLPSRTISAEDSFAKIINKRSFLWTEAVTEASERVKTGSLQQGDVAGFIRGFVDNPPPRVEMATG